MLLELINVNYPVRLYVRHLRVFALYMSALDDVRIIPREFTRNFTLARFFLRVSLLVHVTR